MGTLASLAASLGDQLVPVGGSPPPTISLTGVHISELADPTPFLAGGELLLTTGMNMAAHSAAVEAYAASLAAHGVAALGFGVGPVHDLVPEALVSACAATDLPLLVVPAHTPFLVISREFWRHVSEADHDRLNAELGAYRGLMRAAAGRRPATDVVRVLAGAVHGWAAVLAPGGDVVAVWPRDAATQAARAGGEVRRLRMGGPNSAATFPLGDDDVVVYPVARRRRPQAYVAAAAHRPTPSSLRALALSATALLELGVDLGVQRVQVRRAEAGCVTRLLAAGSLEAARSLAGELFLPLPSSVRAVVAATPRAGEIHEGLAGEVLSVADRPDRLLVLVPLTVSSPTDPRTALEEFVLGADPTARLVTSRALRPGEVAAALPALQGRLGRVGPGTSEPPADGAETERDVGALEALLRYRRADLVAGVAAYLRHQGRAEPAAAELGVHRNTLRHRIGVAQKRAGIDLSDPDTAARWWLMLRARCLA